MKRAFFPPTIPPMYDVVEPAVVRLIARLCKYFDIDVKDNIIGERTVQEADMYIPRTRDKAIAYLIREGHLEDSEVLIAPVRTFIAARAFIHLAAVHGEEIAIT